MLISGYLHAGQQDKLDIDKCATPVLLALLTFSHTLLLPPSMLRLPCLSTRRVTRPLDASASALKPLQQRLPHLAAGPLLVALALAVLQDLHL